MTNEQIIFDARLDLMEKGVIGGTGRFIECENENGEKIRLEEPEEIHTYAAWKEYGFQVRRGQKAIASFPIWKFTIKKAKEENEEDTEKMFMTKAFFFTAAQVEPITERED